MSKVAIKGSVTGSLNATAKIKQKHGFSKQHLKAAEYFAKRAEKIESRTTPISEEIKSQHRAYVTATILSAAAALESSINEFYSEAQDNDPNTLKGLDKGKISLLGQTWIEIKGPSILPKYQMALLVIGVGKFDKEQLHYQDADSLIKLRNALVHYKPEWDDNLDIHKNLKKRLSGKFDECAYAPHGSLWFPHKCLSSGCAQWSVKIIKAFMCEFCQKAKIPARF